MSLRDTITGATKEAREATASLSKKENSEETERPSYSAFGRKSAATAKPVREAAASVRVSGSGSGSSAPKSKEEKRAARARQREREDIRSRGFEAMLRADQTIIVPSAFGGSSWVLALLQPSLHWCFHIWFLSQGT